MSHLANQLLRAARSGARELAIKPRDVRRLAVYISLCSSPRIGVEVISFQIEQGNMKVLGVPIRVLGTVKQAA